LPCVARVEHRWGSAVIAKYVQWDGKRRLTHAADDEDLGVYNTFISWRITKLTHMIQGTIEDFGFTARVIIAAKAKQVEGNCDSSEVLRVS
jgi:hypothetical protein